LVLTIVFIPKWTGIDISLTLNHTDGSLPLASRILRLHHIHAKVRIAPVDIVPTIVVADTWSPHASAMLRGAEMLQQRLIALIQIPKGVVDDLPVHQILRVEDR
jgi:hypothetical protein